MTLSVCSAASLRSSRSSRMSALSDRSIGPALSADTAGGANVFGVVGSSSIAGQALAKKPIGSEALAREGRSVTLHPAKRIEICSRLFVEQRSANEGAGGQGFEASAKFEASARYGRGESESPRARLGLGACRYGWGRVEARKVRQRCQG